MDTIISKMLETVSVEYMVSVILASYFVIKVIDIFNGQSSVPSWVKRLTTCIVGVVLFFIFKRFTDTPTQCLIASFFSAVFVYDAAIKAVIKKLKIGYREEC